MELVRLHAVQWWANLPATGQVTNKQMDRQKKSECIGCICKGVLKDILTPLNTDQFNLSFYFIQMNGTLQRNCKQNADRFAK